MKNVITITLVLLAGILLWLLSSCGGDPPQNQTIALSVLIDRTDELELAPEKELIYGLFRLNPKSLTEVETGVSIRVSEISSVDFNRSNDITIAPTSYREINIKARQKEIKAFYQKLDQAFTKTETKSLNSSSIFVPVAREANRLAKLPANQKILVLYSDLAEHSSWLNAYREYRTSRDMLVKKFKEQITLSDLTGLKLIIRYIPRNTEDNEQFNQLIKVYTQLFEEKGATISFEF